MLERKFLDWSFSLITFPDVNQDWRSYLMEAAYRLKSPSSLDVVCVERYLAHFFTLLNGLASEENL